MSARRYSFDLEKLLSLLVVCRAEQSSSIPTWLNLLGEEATVVLSLYGKPEPGVHFFKGGKWAGIYDLLLQHPELVENNEYFWFPDDDILTTPENALNFLKICQDHAFELAQPALTSESYFAYRETIENPRFRFRNTNFVELMLPCMQRGFLRRVLPMFEKKHAALGLDWMWQQFATDPLNKIAIVDACAMHHSRPRNTHLAAKMRDQSVSINDERAATFATYAIPPMRPVVYKGQLRSGKEVANNLRITLELLVGYLTVQPLIINGKWNLRHTYKLIKKQLRRALPIV